MPEHFACTREFLEHAVGITRRWRRVEFGGRVFRIRRRLLSGHFLLSPVRWIEGGNDGA